MKILLIGQATLHWGRMEYGNIGNYYVIEPFVRELHIAFPSSEIRTTLQMSDNFCVKEKVIRLPMELYYSWDDKNYLEKSLAEYGSALLYSKTGVIITSSPYIEEVMNSDLIIDLSGDVWGDNADLVGPNRFLIGLLKDRVAQLMNNKVVMIAGSPGPFDQHQDIHAFTKEVFHGFDLVTNRECVSTKLLIQEGFDVEHVKDFACPSFLFEASTDKEIEEIILREKIKLDGQKTVGFILCGWNMLEGPFSKWPRRDDEYRQFAEVVEYIINELGLRVVLFSHNNGFELPPNFKPIHGRDFSVVKQLYEVVHKRGNVNMNKINLVEGIYNPKQMKAIIRQFDMLVSGRVHGAVAGLSQFIPTVIIDYGHEPKTHKLRGFAEVAQVGEYIADPSDIIDMKNKVSLCWNNRIEYSNQLRKRIPVVQELAKMNFDELMKLDL